jgi:flagellar P-ring protein precursor FlgI
LGHTAYIADANAQRIKEITDIAGERPNQLVGYGLVVGLDGTGDLTAQTPFTIQTIRQMMSSLGVTIPDTPGYNNQTWLRNVAAVMVTAELPSSPKPGQRIDITVSAMGSSRSLKGGTLLMSGLLTEDETMVCEAALAAGFELQGVYTRDNWISIKCGKA